MKYPLHLRILMTAVLGLALGACSTASAASEKTVLDTASAAAQSVQSSTEAVDPVGSTAASVPNTQTEQDFSQNGISEQELKTAQAKFEEVFAQVPAVELYEGQYDGCKRYTLVNDYDGDGTLEAFAFFGIESDEWPQPYWENICIYYIDSDYNVIPLAGGGSGYDTYIGSISCPEPYYADDFSNCFYESGKEHYLVWNVSYWEGDRFVLILGVHNGEPVRSYPGSVFYINDAGKFVTMDDNYNEVPVELKDGAATPLA